MAVPHEAHPMTPTASFRDLLRRVRDGDESAAAELVKAYEPPVRRAVRTPLTDNRLRYVLDSGDISQTVFANFFARAADDQFDLADPEHLLGLLVTMARNNVRDEARRDRAGVRDRRRVADAPDHCLNGVLSSEPTPSGDAASREFADRLYRQLAPDERVLLERRVAGDDWNEIAESLGGTPSGLRKKLSRAVKRIVGETLPGGVEPDSAE